MILQPQVSDVVILKIFSSQMKTVSLRHGVESVSQSYRSTRNLFSVEKFETLIFFSQEKIILVFELAKA